MKHIHGGDPSHYFVKFGLSEKEVLDFSVNINPLGPPQTVKEIWNELFSKVHLYPSIDGDGVKEFYRKKFGLPEEFVLPGNGSTELIYLIARTIPTKAVAIIKPSYFDYERACILAEKQIISIYIDPLIENTEYKLLEKIKKAFLKADAIWIGRPNNPTGSVISKDLILFTAKNFSDKWIILDEAFIQFLDDWKEQTFISADIPENILVLHSLTKFYAIPGIRAGALISRPENIRLALSKKEPWTVNILAEEISKRLVSVSVEEYEAETRNLISKERKKLYNALLNIERITPVPSNTNFILCKYDGDLDSLLRYLLENRIYVRDCRNFDGLKGSFFRIGIRMPQENELLISKLISY